MSLEETTLRLLEHVESRFYGKYRGVVTDNADPLHRGRIKAHVPEVLADVESGWCTPCVPYAGPDKGWFVIPEVGDGVWVEFEGGDPSRPIWVGSWWGDGDIPNDPDGAQATTETKIFKSASGLIVDLDDSAKEIRIGDKDGSNIITITTGGGQVVIKATANVTVEAPSIVLGENGTHPLVLGDSLVVYLSQLTAALQAHFHAIGIVPTTPPAVPFTPPAPSLLSTISVTK